MKKIRLSVLCIIVLFLFIPNNAGAAKIENDNIVYVAGNPDLYPFEYYEPRTDSYQGILPELYKQISEETGLEFIYIHPGLLNQQSRLAKNCQVDLVSAYVRGQVKNVEREIILLKYEKDAEISVGFTAIAPKHIVEPIHSFLENVSDQQLLDLAVTVPERRPNRNVYLYAGIVVGVLAVITVALSVVLVRKRNEEKKKNEARFIDPMTGIGNTLYFENTFRHNVTQFSHALYYVSYISLDIQRVEQFFGTLEAEEIQRYAADVLSRMAADGDFVARTTDGVFLLAFQAPSEEEASVRIAEVLNRLNNCDNKLFEKSNALFRAGIFWMNTANLPVETAIFNARKGYSEALQNKIPYVFADQKLLDQAAAKIALQRKLSEAFAKQEFQLYMQLIVDRDGQIVGAEALSRWQSREKGLLTPATFIEPLKEADLIDKLDFFILEEVCRQLEQWAVSDKGHLWFSCNFTRLTVSRDDFLARFREIVERYRFDADRLVIELTEDSLQDNTAEAYRNILECKKLGYRIALDDLGSGYSSLQDLCDYPIDIIKIDRHILLKAVTPRGRALLQSLTKMGHELGMQVLCEGVENESDNQIVCNAECDYIQGFYYSRVLPQDEAELFYMRCQEKCVENK